jgi:hypothetical protein
VAVSGMTGDGTVIATIATNKAQDTAGNTNAASTSTDNTVTYDKTAPTVTVNHAVGQADPTNVSPLTFTVVFSEPVTGFATGDATLSGTVTGPLIGAVTGGPTTYTVAVSGMTGDGTVIATIPADVAQDAAANGNDASTSSDNTVTYDKTAPTVTVTSLGTQDTTPPLSGTVDDPTATIQVTVNGANYSATNNGDGTWTLADNTITPALAVGVYEVTATATDTAGNVGTDATTNELTIRSKTLVTDVWGGTWQDANQTGDGDDDDFCWAAAAADLLAWGGRGDGDLYNTAQAIFTNFKGHWTDLAGQMAYGWRWWLNGTLPPTRGYTGSKVNVAGAGKYWSTILASNYLYLDSVTSGLLDTISHAFTDGFGVTAGLVQTLTSTVGHALTVWGYESDALLGYTGLYVTDASDGVTALQYVPIRYDTTLNVWTLEGDYAGWYLREIQAFGRRGGLTATTAFGGSGTGTGFLYGQDTSGAVPEPGTLVCVTLGLVGFAALMRRRLRRR